MILWIICDMNKYFITQLKRLWRLLPIAFCVLGLLFGSVYLIYRGVVSQWSESDTFKKMNIGIVGVLDDPYLQMGLDALQTMDDTNLSLTLIEMEEQVARSQLEAGEISAYIVFPDGFMNKALMGMIDPLQFVSASGSENIISLVKDEFTKALADILLSSECGSFGIADALEHYGYDENFQYIHMNKLAVEYVELVLDRNTIFTVEECGVSDGLKFDQYMLCGLSVLFIFLMALPFINVFVQQESTMDQLLKSRGIGTFFQVFCELGAYCLFFYVLSMLLLPLLNSLTLKGFLLLIPVVFCIASISYFIYGISSDLISGVLLQMVTALGLCFISGCIYPISFFPVSVQKLADYLPAGVARKHLESMLMGENSLFTALILFLFGVVFMSLSVVSRHLKISREKEGKR